jgi:hypothetical protein
MSTVLAKMAVQISANTAEFNKALTSTSNNLKNFTGGIQRIAGTIGIAFGVQQVAAFGLEVSKLGGQAEAVEAAFRRLSDSETLILRLKDATGGTVSELELMKRAVQASNFDISLEALPRLLEFATLRAQQTGQSVDYLVDSIVTGIGRKSKLILDNLGISAAQLGEELKGVSTDAASVGDVADAVGRIAEKALGNMSGFSENASTKLQRLSAEWDNLKVAIGQAANGTGILGNSLNFLTGVLRNLTNTFSDTSIHEYLKAAKELKELRQQAANRGDLEEWERVNMFLEQVLEKLRAYKIENKEVEKSQASLIDTIAEYDAEIKRLTESNQNLTLSDAAQIRANGILIDQYQKQKKALEDLAFVKFKSASAAQPLSIPSSSSLGNANLGGITMPDKVGIEGTGIQQSLDNFRAAANEVQLIQAELSGSTADFVSSMAESLGASLTGNENFGNAFLLSIARFGQSFGKQLIALGIAQIAFKKSFANPVAAVAAGIALTIASSAIAGSVSRFNSNGGGNVGGSAGGGRISSSSLTSTAGQNQFSYETVIRGQDLYVILNTYSKNRNRTSAING